MSSNPSGRSLQFDPSLLQPIVRSKRTPIACTECRRRQVKCSGTLPRCERCTKKNIECTYVSLSEQRAGTSTGGSISRSGTPAQSQSHLGSSSAAVAGGHRHSSGRLSHSSAPLGWQGTSQGYPAASSGYPVAQGWQADSPGSSPVNQFGSQGMQSSQNQSYAAVPVAFPQSFGQQTAYGQGAAGQGSDMFATQGYAQQQQGFAAGTSYNAYGHPVPATDPRYAYQAAQMAAMTGEDQQSAAYMAQYSQQTQMFFDPTSGQMVSTGQWAENPDAPFQSQNYHGHN